MTVIAETRNVLKFSPKIVTCYYGVLNIIVEDEPINSRLFYGLYTDLSLRTSSPIGSIAPWSCVTCQRLLVLCYSSGTVVGEASASASAAESHTANGMQSARCQPLPLSQTNLLEVTNRLCVQASLLPDGFHWHRGCIVRRTAEGLVLMLVDQTPMFSS